MQIFMAVLLQLVTFQEAKAFQIIYSVLHNIIYTPIYNVHQYCIAPNFHSTIFCIKPFILKKELGILINAVL